MVRSPREVKRKGAVIAEAIQRAATGTLADQYAILTLIEKRAGLLTAPRGGDHPNPVFVDLDFLRHRSTEQLSPDRQILLSAKRDVIAGENSLRFHEMFQRIDDHVAKRLQAGAHQLHHQPSVVAVADQRRARVAFSMHQPVRVRRGLQRCSARNRIANAAHPPVVVQRRSGVAIHHSQRDFGCGTPERHANRLSTLVDDANRAGRR